MYQLLIGLIALIPILALALGLIYFYLAFHKQKEEILATRARRYRHSTTFHYDQNGNPEYIYDPSTDKLIIPPSANTSYAPTIMIRDSIQRNIKSDSVQPILYNIPRKADSFTDGKTIEEIEQAAEISETSNEVKLPNSEGETVKYIDKCIAERVAMTRAARAIDINPGENKPYLAFKSLWATRVAIKDSVPYLNQSSREGKDS